MGRQTKIAAKVAAPACVSAMAPMIAAKACECDVEYAHHGRFNRVFSATRSDLQRRFIDSDEMRSGIMADGERLASYESCRSVTVEEIEERMNESSRRVTGSRHDAADGALPVEVDRRSVYVGNVAYGSTQDKVQAHFRECGLANRITLLVDHFTGRPKGFAYIEFADEQAVLNALSLHGSLFCGRPLKVCQKRTNIPNFFAMGKGTTGRDTGKPPGKGHKAEGADVAGDLGAIIDALSRAVDDATASQRAFEHKLQRHLVEAVDAQRSIEQLRAALVEQKIAFEETLKQAVSQLNGSLGEAQLQHRAQLDSVTGSMAEAQHLALAIKLADFELAQNQALAGLGKAQTLAREALESKLMDAQHCFAQQQSLQSQMVMETLKQATDDFAVVRVDLVEHTNRLDVLRDVLGELLTKSVRLNLDGRIDVLEAALGAS